MPPTVTVVVVSYNTLEYTRACLEHLVLHTDVPMRLVIVDNASSDGSREFLALWVSQGVGERFLISNDRNQGFARACNQGMEFAPSGSFIALVNSDLMVSPRWASRLLAHFSDTDRVAAVGPMGSGMGGAHDYARFFGPAGFETAAWPLPSGYADFAEKVYRENRGRFRTAKALSGSCLVMSPEAAAEVGRLDEELFMGADDCDWSVRARLLNYDLVVARDVYVWHKCHASLSQLQTDEYRRVIDSTWRHFNLKWQHVLPYGSWDDQFDNDKDVDLPRFKLVCGGGRSEEPDGGTIINGDPGEVPR